MRPIHRVVRVFAGAAVAFSLHSPSVLAVPTQPELPWDLVSDEEGIRTFRRELEGSPIISFRGETVIDAPIGKIVSVLGDSRRKTEWMDRLVATKTLRMKSFYERVEYNHTAAPWPFKDRDFVLKAEASVDRVKRALHIHIRSTEEPELAPVTKDKVRGLITRSHFELRSTDGDTRTWIAVEVHADLRGAIPKWVVNLVQKTWPRKTLDGIRRQAAKPDVLEHPEAKRILDEFNATPVAAR